MLEQQGESDSCIRVEMPPKGIRRHLQRGLVTAPFQCASAAASKGTAEKKRREGLCLWRARAPASLFLFAYRTFILFILSQHRHPSVSVWAEEGCAAPLAVCFAVQQLGQAAREGLCAGQLRVPPRGSAQQLYRPHQKCFKQSEWLCTS